ncbi:NACHT domain-containing protein [Zunongwangia atlantica]|uniref:NACHT domain-containing protein n=1 Tax=Zunongwangia atlantica 22II14-10F7 TaxID=1185767 RepID=A0A1Y1SZJ6_9FLAO|nr:hypothetical protein [Zunongwangia atlantica]ORL43673.1 hypothetical protein IIF7_19644 [Zunongwangia atlantica 22II14-10F7]
MKKIRFFGIFQKISQTYYQIFRQPFDVDKGYFNSLETKHFNKEFTLKYSENLFVDQDKGHGRDLINEILLNKDHFQDLLNELKILKDWIEDFEEQYKTLKNLLQTENIPVNLNSKQHKQLEFLLNNRQTLLEQIYEIDTKLKQDIKSLPLTLKVIDNTNLEFAESFDFQRLNQYEEEKRYIELEPTEPFQLVVVFRRLSQIVTQIASVNRLIIQQKKAQVKFIHGNAGMGKSNFSAFLYTELRKKDKSAILISGKSFGGDPNDFDEILMKQINIPNGYLLEEVLEKLNRYGEKNGSRVTLIFDGLNETSFAHEGFSKIWENSLDNFIEKLEKYPYLFFIATLRTSYISRIWSNNEIPYEQIKLNGFRGDDLRLLIQRYFKEYKIATESLIPSDVFYFETPLFLDLYCKMLNEGKVNTVEPQLGLGGFKEVFDKYLENLVAEITQKLDLYSGDLVREGIEKVSQKMLEASNAFIPIKSFYQEMDGENVKSKSKTIGHQVLQEYLIYLDENLNNRDVIIHTQQEVGGYLLASRLINTYGNINAVTQSDFFKDYILGESGNMHQLKDDILKFLINDSDADSLLFQNHLNLEVVKKFTLLDLKRTKISKETQAIIHLLKQEEYSKDEIRTLLEDSSETFYDPESNLNFLFIKDILLKVDNYKFDFTWTYYLYNNYYDFNEFIKYFTNNPEEIISSEETSNNTIIELAIWLLETTIRDLRDKSTKLLLQYFVTNPDQILTYLIFYSVTNRDYINERLALVAYGICLRLQNNKSFIDNELGKIARKLYNLQFAKEPDQPTYNYIVIDSYKHIIDLAILKGVFELDDSNLLRLANYRFNKDDWFSIDDKDREAVPIATHWSLTPNPDPLAGDFVHYTIPRLDNRDYETRLDHTANIFKQILRLGYVSNDENLSKREQSFYNGTSLLGSRVKVDRLGKKYSWIAYFNYAGYLLNQNKLGVWHEENSKYKKHYERLSDTEIEPSYDDYKPYEERVINIDFFVNRDIENSNWINSPNYNILDSLYTKEDYTLLSAFIDQKLDKEFKTRSWIQAQSFFVNRDQIIDYIEQIENKEFDWKDNLHNNGSLSNTYFGELYWADTIPFKVKDHHSFPIEGTKEITRRIKHYDVLKSDDFSFEDIGKEITETINETCHFEYEQTLVDFLWETDSIQFPALRRDIPSPNFGKHLSLTVDSSQSKILCSNLEECFKEYYAEYQLNSENFHYFRTDLLEKYLKDTNQLLLFQLKQHTYDQVADNLGGHFRGMQFKFSNLNR